VGAWVAILSFIFLMAPFFKNMFATEGEHLTAYFSMFVLAAVFNGFNVRSASVNIFENIKENPGFIKVMAIIVVVQVIMTIVGGSLFSCTPIEPKHWIVVILLAVTVIPVDMIRKAIFKTAEK
ncbi:MAG: cation transporting ATPase C-terminal domain-containing protein, partial [Clostridium sp.]